MGGGADSSGANSASDLESDITPSSVIEITDQPGADESFIGAAEDSEITRCEATAAGWVSEGTVTNSTDSTQNYRIYVGFKKNSDAKALIQVDVTSVAPGETENWRTETNITGEGLNCNQRVERAEA